jgi:peptide/nickel transport system substrate-binding protein
MSTGPFNPLSKQFNSDISPWPFDADRARALLKEAGFEDRDKDGVIESPDGVPFDFKLTYPGGNANYEKMVLSLKDSFARAGIVLRPDPLDWAVLVERLNKKNFDAISLGWSAGIETDIYQMFHSSQSMNEGDNFTSYKSDELDATITEARRTLNEDNRMTLWRKAHSILHEDQPYTFLSFGKSLLFVDRRFQNVELTKLGLNPRVEWFVPSGEQRWTN